MDPLDTQKLLSNVDASSSDAHSFMREYESEGTQCMSSVVVSALCSLSKRYLIMESAAGGWYFIFFLHTCEISKNKCNIIDY